MGDKIPNMTISVGHEMYMNLTAKSQVDKISLSKAAQYYIRLGMVREREIQAEKP